eukprot:353286-Chlamydomonas_euryale.AAC.7
MHLSSRQAQETRLRALRVFASVGPPAAAARQAASSGQDSKASGGDSGGSSGGVVLCSTESPLQVGAVHTSAPSHCQHIRLPSLPTPLPTNAVRTYAHELCPHPPADTLCPHTCPHTLSTPVHTRCPHTAHVRCLHHCSRLRPTALPTHMQTSRRPGMHGHVAGRERALALVPKLDKSEPLPALLCSHAYACTKFGPQRPCPR